MKKTPTSRRKRTHRLENGATYEPLHGEATVQEPSPPPKQPPASPSKTAAASQQRQQQQQQSGTPQKRRAQPRQLTPAQAEARKCKRLVDQTHPVLLPIGLRRTFCVDCPSYTPKESEYLTNADLRELLVTGLNSVSKNFAYKEQYYEIAFRGQHEGLPDDSTANYLLHLHKTLDESVTTFYPHTHLFPFDAIDIPPSITTCVSAHQLSRGTTPDFVFAGAIPALDEELLLEELSLATVLFDDFRTLETVTQTNRRFMNSEVSQVLQDKKDALGPQLVAAFARDVPALLARKKGIVFAERLFAVLPAKFRAQVVMAVVEALPALAALPPEHLPARLSFLRIVGAYLRDLTDVVEICEYVGVICEGLEDGPACFSPPVAPVVGIIQNATLREEERGTYDEFIESCRDLSEEHRDAIDPEVLALLAPTQ